MSRRYENILGCIHRSIDQLLHRFSKDAFLIPVIHFLGATEGQSCAPRHLYGSGPFIKEMLLSIGNMSGRHAFAHVNLLRFLNNGTDRGH